MKHFFLLILFGVFVTTAWAQSARNKTVTVYTTAQNTGLRLSVDSAVQLKAIDQPVEKKNCLFINPDKKFQTILGIGGALTDASAEVFSKLPVEKQKELLTAYYDPKNGIGYTLGRVNMNSCDFSSDSYDYVAHNDVSLKTFSVKHDEKYKIPFIKAAERVAGGKVTLFFTPWSPPAWMKSNNDMLHGGKLLPQYRQAWANYYARFIKAYTAQGINFWGLTVQNEPLAVQTWESCNYTAGEELDFVKNYLGPQLAKQGLGSKKIIVWDHNRDFMYQWAETIYSDPQASKYIWGMGYHWYETWKGGNMLFENEAQTTSSYPSKNLMFTEGCIEKFSMAEIDNWSHGERYAYSMINDFNNGTVGWTDWNILLDENGGPNHVGNFCFAPVHAITSTGELIYTNSFYYIGQFSKFVRPGAKRLACSSNFSDLAGTAFQNTDGSVAVVVLNRTDKVIPYQVWLKDKAITFTARPHSISTFVIK